VTFNIFDCWTVDRRHGSPFDNGDCHVTAFRPISETAHNWSHWRSPGGGRGHARNLVHKKIPGCAVELNTQNCAWFGSQISLITAMSFREAVPPEPPTRGSAPGRRWGLPFPRPPVPPPPNPGCATGWSYDNTQMMHALVRHFQPRVHHI